jgi:hypothetical protein
MDLPRFRGEMRAWDQALWLDVMLSSGFVAFFGSAPGGAILPFSNRRPECKRFPDLSFSIPFFCSTAPQAFFRPDRRLARPLRAVAGLVVAGLGSVRGSMAPRRLADRCRCQVHRSLRGPAALAAPWPQGFDAAMSRTRSARLAQEESRGRRGPSRQGQLPLLQQRTSFN